MARLYTEADIAQIDAAITAFRTARGTPSTWFGIKARHGGGWSGTIASARRMHANLQSSPPDNLTPQSVTVQLTTAINRLGEIING